MDELQDIVLMKLDVWDYDVDMGSVFHRKNLRLEQKKGGLLLRDEVQLMHFVAWYGIFDPTYDYSVSFLSKGEYRPPMWLFNSPEEAQAAHDLDWLSEIQTKELFT